MTEFILILQEMIAKLRKQQVPIYRGRGPRRLQPVTCSTAGRYSLPSPFLPSFFYLPFSFSPPSLSLFFPSFLPFSLPRSLCLFFGYIFVWLLAYIYVCVCVCVISENGSVMSDSLRLHGLYNPWDYLGQNTGVGSLSLLQRIIPSQGLNPGLPHSRRILYQLSHYIYIHTHTYIHWDKVIDVKERH